MSKRLLALLLGICLVLSGCAGGNTDEADYVGVYYMSADSQNGGALLQRQVIVCRPQQEKVDAILDGMNSRPEQIGLERVFPEGVIALGCEVEQGIATVSMIETFARLDQMEKLLCAAALTLSLTELDEICAVNIECAGKPYFRQLRPEDIQWSDALFESYERIAKLFLPGEGGVLVPCSRMLKVDGTALPEELIARAVLSELPVYTEATELRSVNTENGVCTLDLSEAFYGNEPADQTEGMLIIHALVNSLCRLNNVDSVIICVEGQRISSYGGYRLAWPLAPRGDIVAY